MMKSMKSKTKSLKAVAALVLTAAFFGCSMLNGYMTLAPDEKLHYEKVADYMTIDQRMEYLSQVDHPAREAYLKKMGLDRATFVSTRPPRPPVGHEQPAAANAQDSTMAGALWGKKPEAPAAPVAAVAPVTVAVPKAAAVPPSTIVPESPLVEKPLLDLSGGNAVAPKAASPYAAAPVPASTLVPQSPLVTEKTAAVAVPAPAPVAPVSPYIPPPAPPSVSIAPPPVQIQAPAPIVPTAPAPSTVASAKPAAVDYTRTGDPVTDVLTLLELYEAGKITKDQFEQEKEIAMQKTAR